MYNKVAHQLIQLAFINALESGESSDLVVTCQGHEWKVHKVILCNAYDFFKKACAWKERNGQEQIVDFPDDSPDMIRRLLLFAYIGDYDPSNPSEIMAFRDKKHFQTIEQFQPCPTPHSKENELIAFWSRHTINSECPCMSPVPDNASALPAAKVSKDEDPDSNGYGLAAVQNPLLINATMYQLGDKYCSDELQYAAFEKFQACLENHWDSDEFVEAVNLAFLDMPSTDTPLCGLIRSFLENRVCMSAADDVDILGIEVCIENGEFTRSCLNELKHFGFNRNSNSNSDS